MDVYYSNLDFEVSDDLDRYSLDGSGGGLGFWMGNKVGMLTAELQANKLDGTVEGFAVDSDTRLLRAGMGFKLIALPTQGAWIRAEYINFDADLEVEGFDAGSDTQDGYGVHAGGLFGIGVFNAYGEIGFVDVDDLDGMEYRVGVAVQPSIVGGFVEYRKTALELNDFDIDEDFEDIRIGLRVAF